MREEHLRSSCSGNELGYVVQVRRVHVVGCGQCADLPKEWSDVRTKKGTDCGIQNGARLWSSHLLELANVMSYEAAEAIRWWVLSDAAFESCHHIETRLVKHDIEFSIRVVERPSGREVDDESVRPAVLAVTTGTGSGSSE